MNEKTTFNDLYVLIQAARSIGLRPTITIYSDLSGSIDPFAGGDYHKTFMGFDDMVLCLASVIRETENRTKIVDNIFGKFKKLFK